MRDHTAYVR